MKERKCVDGLREKQGDGRDLNCSSEARTKLKNLSLFNVWGRRFRVASLTVH